MALAFHPWGPGSAEAAGLAPMWVGKATSIAVTLTAFVDIRGDLHRCV
jgi:hypothetical protein